MSPTRFRPATAPTLYFIGVTTGQSSIVPIFPKWAKRLGLKNARLAGVDVPIGADPDTYRDIVRFIKRDPLSMGALITTHKIDLLAASRDLFDELDPYARLLGEISCISKQGDKLLGHAKDAETGQRALHAFLPDGYWKETGAEALFLGAGGATVATTSLLLTAPRNEQPVRITITDIDRERIRSIRAVHEQAERYGNVRYLQVRNAADSDAALRSLPDRSVVINGTGMGKDRPGSPVSDQAVFPENGYAWDYNYRGDFTFLKQAEACRRGVKIVDGWAYFLYGWTSIVAEVFGISIPEQGPEFEALSEIAEAYRRRRPAGQA